MLNQTNKDKNFLKFIKYFLIFLMGGFASLSLPPLSFSPIIFLITIPLFHLVNSKNLKDAFLIGYFLAFGWFLVSLYWISNAILVGGEEFLWMIPFVFICFPAFLSVFWGLAFFFTNLIGRSIVERLILFSIFLPFFEWLRGNLLTGFPWNMIGFSLSSPLEIAQSIALLGPYGQNVIIALALSIPITIFYNKKILTLLSIISCGLVFLASFYAFKSNIVSFTDKNVKLVQPNFSHSEKWDKKKFFINQEKLLDLSKNYSGKNTLIIWPETAIVNFPENIKKELMLIKETILTKNSVFLITGIPRKEVVNNQKYYYNSMIVVDKTGSILGTYNKNKLVPFGEYNPFKKVLSFFKIIASDNEFSHGGLIKEKFFSFGDINLYPLICYEAIFPFQTRKDKSYDLIVNITNDRWFGKTFGPEQHFWLAKQRAIETGIPMVRVSNSGISSLIAPNGKEIKSLEFGTSGFLELKIPKKFNETLYLKFGEKIYYLMTLFLMFLFLTVKFKSSFIILKPRN